MDELPTRVAAAAHEQSQGIEQVNMAMSGMHKVTQSNAADAEESASAEEELKAQADTLQGAVQELLALVCGNVTGASHHHTKPISTQGEPPN